MKCIEDYILKGTDVPGLFSKMPSVGELKNMLFRSNNSRTRAYILLLASLAPRNITNGMTIDIQDALSIFNKKQYHHIYPQAYLKGLGINQDKINSISNICILAASENNYVSDKNPNIYIPELIDKLGDEYEKIFLSNLLPILERKDYEKISFDEFINLRSEEIYKRMKNLCDGVAF